MRVFCEGFVVVVVVVVVLIVACASGDPTKDLESSKKNPSARALAELKTVVWSTSRETFYCTGGATGRNDDNSHP